MVIGAYPSCGKSALAMNIITHNVLLGVPAAVGTAEMRPVRLMMRSMCSEARVNSYDIRDGKINEGDFVRLGGVGARLANSPLHIKNVTGWSISQLQAWARRVHQQHGIKMLAIDYLQLISAKSDKREQEVAAVSRGCKAIAMELDIPVLVLSQLNDDGKLRESRSLGQDGDSVWILKNDGDWNPKVQSVNLRVEKSREGTTGDVKLTFLKTITRFECATTPPKIDPQDYPRK